MFQKQEIQHAFLNIWNHAAVRFKTNQIFCFYKCQEGVMD